MDAIATGYQSSCYAESLREFGQPRSLPQAGGWFLKRSIAGSQSHDGMGCYPILSCRDWTKFKTDLSALGNELVCISAVIDPFGNHTEALLKECFPDVMIHFKNHFVTDLSLPQTSYIPARHLRNVKKAAAVVVVEKCEHPPAFLDDWARLYGVLISRHSIHGLSAFSRASFAQQLETPGLVVFRAILDEATVGMILWFVQNGVAYYHLAAYSDAGYEARASFALFWNSIEYFANQNLKWLNLGASAGTGTNPADAQANGLNIFKSGWATGQRPVWFCGRVFDQTSYQAIVRARNQAPTAFFPAYRNGEFA